MIHEKKPEGFNPSFEIVSCFVEFKGRILLLHRQDHKPEGGTWGVPAGKTIDGEEVPDAVLREVEEETGLCLPRGEIKYFKKVYVRYPRYDFVYHIFHSKLDDDVMHRVKINDGEHKSFRWVTPSEALEMPLIGDLDSCIKLFYGI